MPIRQSHAAHVDGEVPQFTRRRTFTAAPPPRSGCCAAPSTAPPAKAPNSHRTSERRPHPVSAVLRRAASAPAFTRREVVPLSDKAPTAQAGSCSGAPSPTPALETSAQAIGAQVVTEALRLAALCVEESSSLPHAQTTAATLSSVDVATLQRLERVRLRCLSDVSESRAPDACLYTVLHASVLMTCSFASFAATAGDMGYVSALCGDVAATNTSAHAVQTFNAGAQALVHVQSHRNTATTAADAVLFAALHMCDDCTSTSAPTIAVAVDSFREAARPRRDGDGVADAAQPVLVCAATSVEDVAVPLQDSVHRLTPRHISWVAFADGAPPTQCTRVNCFVACPETATGSDVDVWEAHLRRALHAMAEAGRAQRALSQTQGPAKHREGALGGLAFVRFASTSNVNGRHVAQAALHGTRSSAPSLPCARLSSPPPELSERRATYYARLAEALRKGVCAVALDKPHTRTTSARCHGAFRRSHSHAGPPQPPPPLAPRRQRTRRTASAAAPPLAVRTRATEHLPVLATTAAAFTASPSPEPCVPPDCLSARTIPNLSPIRPVAHKGDGASLRTYEPSATAPSTLSSPGRARTLGDAAVGEPVRRGARTPHLQRAEEGGGGSYDAVRQLVTPPRTAQAPTRSRQLHPDNVVRHVTRSKGRLGGGPDALMHTLPPQKRRERSRRVSSDDVAAQPRVRLVIHGICGLPREAIRLRPGAAETSAATEVYVYVQSNSGDRRRRKTACVPYAASVAFPSAELVFPVACDARDEEEEGHHHDLKGHTQQVLTLTVAVHLGTGSQLKLGIACIGLCHLQDGVATRVSVPVVAKAGTPAVRERGEMSLTLLTEGLAGGCAPPPEVEEAVRRVVKDALRHGYREELHLAEVLVRQHCRDSLVQLHDVVSQLRRGASPHASSLAESCGGAVGLPDDEHAAALDAFAAPTLRHSSLFTSLVLDDPQRGRCGPSRAAAPVDALLANAAPSRTPDETERRNAVHGGGERVAVRCALHRLLSAPSSTVSSARAEPFLCRATHATTVQSCDLSVRIHAVRNLVDASGLPLQSCASLFLSLHVLPRHEAVHTPVDVIEEMKAVAHTTAAVLYDGHEANFENAVVRLTLPVCGYDFDLRCTVFSGVPGCCEELGVCHVRGVWPSVAAAPQAGREAAEFKLIRRHGSLDAHVCGDLVMTVYISGNASGHRMPPSSAPAADTRAARLQGYVLAWLWQYGRQQLHRLDAIVQDAAASTCAEALAKYPHLLANARSCPLDTATPDVLLVIELAALDGPPFPAAAEAESVPRGHVVVAWSCGAFAGRSKAVALEYCGPAAAPSARVEMVLCLPDSDLLDAAELCVAVCGVGADATARNYVKELCRTHACFRSLRSCRVADPRSPSAVVRLPLVWRAGERGAYERGFVQLRVESAPRRTGERCRAPWPGFSAQWRPRTALRQLLGCYATERLHRMLCVLASAGQGEPSQSYGDDDEHAAMRLVHALERTWGPASSGVRLRVGLLGFRALSSSAASTTLLHGDGAYVKVYHRGRAVLRTPTLRCTATGLGAQRSASLSLPEFEGRSGVVPLLDEDEYLLHFTTPAPHHERLVLTVGLERALGRSAEVACAELSLAAFVSPCEGASMHRGGACAPARRYCWVPLQDARHTTVAEVGVRVEWAPASAAASTTTAVAPAIPLDSSDVAQDVLSLLHAYEPASVCWLLWHVGRFPDPAVAHRRLRQEVLQSAHIAATVYVDVAGVSPRTGAAARREWAVLERGCGLQVSATYLGCRSPLPCPCRRLSETAARATVEAARLLSSGTHLDDGVHGGGPWTAWRHSLRLDLKLPTPATTPHPGISDDLCLTFTTPGPRHEGAARATSAAPRQHRKSRSSSADQARQQRSRSAFALSPSLASCGAPSATVRDRPAAQPAAQVEVGRIWLSLRALCTVPQLYRRAELIVVPLVAHGLNGGPCVLGDVYLRARTPVHESVPASLQCGAAEVSAALRGGALLPSELHGQLRREQLQCERHLTAHADRLAALHARFFRKCTAVLASTPSPPDVAAEEPGARVATQNRERLPVPSACEGSITASSASSTARGVQWRVQEVQPRLKAAAPGLERIEAAQDLTPTPKEMPSRSDGVSEAGGATGGAGSSWARGSSPSPRRGSPSVTVLDTRRELAF